MKREFQVHIDLPDPDGAARLSGIVTDMGGNVTLGAPSSGPPDLLISSPARLGRQAYMEGEAGPDRPNAVIYGESDRLDVRALLSYRVFEVIEPQWQQDMVVRVISAALEEYWNRLARYRRCVEIEERHNDISTVVKLALDIEPELDVDRVSEKIVRQISEDLKYRIVSIMLLDDDEKHLTIRAARGLNRRIVTSSRVEVGKGISGTVAQTGKPLLVSDIENDARFGKLRSNTRYSSKSLICVPLKVGDRVIGVLNGNNRENKSMLTEHDLRILSAFAAHASISIERARLYRILEKKAEELESACEQLKAIDRIKSDFITNVSHEYRTPVTIILGYLELVRGSVNEPSQLEKINVAMEAAQRLSRLVDDCTDLLRMDTGIVDFVFRSVEPSDFLQGIVQDIWQQFGRKGVELLLDLPEELPVVCLDPDKMRKAVLKLLENALKFTPDGGYVKISAGEDAGGGLSVSVEDSGPGIRSQDRSRVFDRFMQGGDIMTDKPEGAGLGLSIAAAIVLRHGGRLEVDDDFKKGCRIVVRLPAAQANGSSGEGRA